MPLRFSAMKTMRFVDAASPGVRDDRCKQELRASRQLSPAGWWSRPFWQLSTEG
jgi:hypothetical protein